MKNEIKPTDRTYDLSEYSHARLGLGHAGGHLNTKSWLDFQLGFAQAKDAVSSSFNVSKIAALHQPSLVINSRCQDLYSFLTHPDWGRCIAKTDEDYLTQLIAAHPEYCHQDILIVVSGGLSPLAITQQIPTFLPELISRLPYSLAPVIINPRGRVALGDHLNEYFKSSIVMMLIGERPGLTTPDSLGIYFTYSPLPGFTDDKRNCISNIHEKGLSNKVAIDKVCELIRLAFEKKVSGLALYQD